MICEECMHCGYCEQREGGVMKRTTITGKVIVGKRAEEIRKLFEGPGIFWIGDCPMSEQPVAILEGGEVIDLSANITPTQYPIINVGGKPEDLLDATMICPLGGDYEMKQAASGMQWWTSSALTGSRVGGILAEPAPEGFVAPPLNRTVF